MHAKDITIHALRLTPGQDIKREVEWYARQEKISAGWIVTCVGSLTQLHLRFAAQAAGTKASGHFEIVSLAGTVGMQGCHLHISISDALGQCTGGHLLFENIVYTTAEIIIGETTELDFTREQDAATGWKELHIKKRESGNY